MAKNEQILIPKSVFQNMENYIIAETLGNFSLKGFQRAVSVHNVIGLRADSDNLFDFSLENKSPMKN